MQLVLRDDQHALCERLTLQPAPAQQGLDLARQPNEVRAGHLAAVEADEKLRVCATKQGSTDGACLGGSLHITAIIITTMCLGATGGCQDLGVSGLMAL